MFLEPSDKINVAKIIDSYEEIRKDYLDFKINDYFIDYTHNRDEILTSPRKTGYFWQVCPLIYNRGDYPRSNDRVKNSFTVDLLKNLEIVPVVATFSVIEPGGDVVPHADHDDEVAMDNMETPPELRTTSIVKYHFSVDVPSDGESALIVGEEKRILKNKDLNIFDETIIHGAYNTSKYPRGVLIISFLRHELY
jgi:aspartyl/asparaginyl beta-hydroxylase (cupin superfamily)